LEWIETSVDVQLDHKQFARSTLAESGRNQQRSPNRIQRSQQRVPPLFRHS
jgi:hypothetical protein